MPTVAYLTNEFPAAVEPYVVEEIRELRQEQDKVIPTSVRRPKKMPAEFQGMAAETMYLLPLSFATVLRAAWLCCCRWRDVLDLLSNVRSESGEPFPRRCALSLTLGSALVMQPCCVTSVQSISTCTTGISRHGWQ